LDLSKQPLNNGMRILCCLNRDLASSMALNLLLPTFERHEVFVGLTERVGTGLQAEEPSERRELRVAEQQLPNDVLFPLVERAGLPDNGDRYLTFAEVERHRGIQVASLPNPNTAAGLEVVRRFAPDLVVTIRYGAILKSSLIAIPRLGVLNLHSGLLPAYRGVLATFRALMHGDTQIGCTLHYITDDTIDTGPIIETTCVPVVPGRSLLWHVLALYRPGVAMLVSALNRLESGLAVPATAQPAAAGEYYSSPSADEWAEFTKGGWNVAQPSDLSATLRRYLPSHAGGDVIFEVARPELGAGTV
jgi:methionyl-tRNA formyltransferase